MSKYFYITGLVALMCLVAGYTIFIGSGYSYNSDNSSFLISVKEIVNGNIFLSGWRLTTVSYYFTDLLFYALLFPFFENPERLLAVVPGIFYSLTIGILSLTYTIKDDGKINFNKTCFLFIFAASISSFMSSGILGSVIHNGAYLFTSISLLLFRLHQVHARRSYALGFFIINILIFYSDTLTIYFYVLPLSAALVVGRWINSKDNMVTFVRSFFKKHRSDFNIIMSLFLALVLSKILLFITHALGGFSVGGYGLRIASFTKIIANVKIFFKGLFLTFGLDSSGVVLLMAIFLTLLIIIGIFFAIKEIRNTNTILLYSLLSVFIMAAGSLAAKKFNGLTDLRYFIGPIIYIKLLAGYTVYDKINKQRVLLPIISILIVIAGAFISLPQSSQKIENVIPETLTQLNLKNGYGSYWNGPYNTIYSSFKHNVYQVRAREYPNEKNIYTDVWSANRKWFGEYSNYLIIDQDDQSMYSRALTTFGEPTNIVDTANKKIMVWDKDISKEVYHIFVDLRGGFSRVYNNNGDYSVWSSNKGRLEINNTSYTDLKVSFDVLLRISGDGEKHHITFSGLVDETVEIYDTINYRTEFVVPPGKHMLWISSDAPTTKEKGAPLFGRFQAINMNFIQLKR